MLEEYLIECCSPTLASLKTANLFSFRFSSERELYGQIAYWNETLRAKGVSLTVLRQCGGSALIYVYRRAKLESDFTQKGVKKFMSECGYTSLSIDSALDRLRARLGQNCEFPHEIGLFLGYPLEDVVGFIRNGGRNYKCTGLWKVYCNEGEAAQTFAKFKKCSRVYARLWSDGRSVTQLTVRT